MCPQKGLLMAPSALSRLEVTPISTTVLKQHWILGCAMYLLGTGFVDLKRSPSDALK